MHTGYIMKNKILEILKNKKDKSIVIRINSGDMASYLYTERNIGQYITYDGDDFDFV